MQVFTEYRDQNAHRNYPFSDDASLVSTGGTRLPNDYLVDAYITPLDVQGPIYMSMLNTATCHAEFTDGDTRTVCATADWTAGDETANVLDVSGFSRQIGLLVFGASTTLISETPLLFSAAAAPLLATCAVPLIQKGVRGIITTQDGKLSTGHVVMDGRNGVVITSVSQGYGLSTVTIDVYGTLPPSPVDCGDDRPYIQAVNLIVDTCSRMVASADTYPDAGTVIAVMGAPGFVLDATCPKPQIPDKDGTLPSQKDVCVTVPPAPEPIDCVDSSTQLVPITTGFITIAAPSTLAAANPFMITTEEGVGVSLDAGIQMPVASSMANMQRQLANLMNTGIRPSGRITISLRGGAR